MSKFRVALLQMTSHATDQEKNCEKGLGFCRQAGDMGADLALFPEMWNIGYSRDGLENPEGQKGFKLQAISRDDEFILRHRELAKELKMGVCITYLESCSGQVRNSLAIIGKDGEINMNYSKVHTCDFGIMEALCAPGEDFFVNQFKVSATTSVKLGAMICYDREFPESGRILMLKGAEVVLTPNACELDSLRIDQFKTRAFENALGMAMTNYPNPKNNGHSVAFDQKGNLIVEAGEREGIYMAEFDLEEIRSYRQSSIWGNAFRRPQRYGPLSSMDVDEVFLRENALGERFLRSKR